MTQVGKEKSGDPRQQNEDEKRSDRCNTQMCAITLAACLDVGRSEERGGRRRLPGLWLRPLV